MSAAFLAFLLLHDEGAIRKAITAYNHRFSRDVSACWAPSQSAMYFEVTTIRFRGDGAAVVEANGNRYGSVFLKRTSPATFVLKREGADWKIDALRVDDGCLTVMR